MCRIGSASRVTLARLKAGCIIVRCRRHSSPLLTMMPLPSSIFTRSKPTPLL